MDANQLEYRWLYIERLFVTLHWSCETSALAKTITSIWQGTFAKQAIAYMKCDGAVSNPALSAKGCISYEQMNERSVSSWVARCVGEIRLHPSKRP